MIVTDAGIVTAGLLEGAIASLKKEGIGYEVFDKVIADPPIRIAEECAAKVKKEKFDCVSQLQNSKFLIVDTAKTAAIRSNSV